MKAPAAMLTINATSVRTSALSFGTFQHARRSEIEQIDPVKAKDIEPAKARRKTEDLRKPRRRVGIGRKRESLGVIGASVERRRGA